MRLLLYRSYGFLCQRKWTGRHLRNIRHIYEIIKPADEMAVICATMLLYMKSMALSVLAILLGFRLLGVTLYHIIMIVTLVYLFHHQVLRYSLGKEELKLLRQMEKYLSDVRHLYHRLNMVEEAIYDSLEEADYEISLHMNRIYQILVSEDEDEIFKYKEVAPNKFLTTFLALCKITIQYGDSQKDGVSLFLTNLNHLRNEINVEILKLEKINYVFSGLVFITIMPVFFLRTIENFSISGLPELEGYYGGTYGIVMSLIIFVATLSAYGIIERLKGITYLYHPRHAVLKWISKVPWVEWAMESYFYHKAGKAYRLDRLIRRTGEELTLCQFYVKRILLFLIAFVFSFFVLCHTALLSKWNVIHYLGDFRGISLTGQESELLQYRMVISRITQKYRKEKHPEKLEESLRKEIQEEYRITDSIGLNLLTDEIISRIQRWQLHKIHWYYPFLAFFIGVLISFIPLLSLNLRAHFMKAEMEDEVMQFQAIIIMLMYIDRMNVFTILEWLEMFSRIFKPSIMECADQYAYDDAGALAGLKEREPFPPLVRIVENLESCDQVGIEKAFDEIIGQRNYYTEKRRQENEISIANKGVVGKVAAYLPLMLTIGFYLIVPFVMESINQLMGYVKQLSF